MASREWGSPASDSASSLDPRSPGILARRALPGLVLFVGLTLLFAPFGMTPPGPPAAEATAWQQPPDDGTPPGDSGGEDGEEEEEPDSAQVAPGTFQVPPDTLHPASADTFQMTPAEVGIKPVRPDTTRTAGPAVGFPHTGLSRPDLPGPPAPGGPGGLGVKPARRGVFGLHPALIVLGLVAAHVVIIKLVTH